MWGYAICTEPRSGSVYLCRLLASTGVLGNPTEYFNGDTLRGRGFADYPDDPEAQLALIPRLGATPNGVYGLKVFAHHFDRVMATRWAQRLPSLAFIHLTRLDSLGQAISHVRAIQTQQWVAHRVAIAEPVYDFDAIKERLVGLLLDQNRWRYFFARNGMPVLHLIYEQMITQPRETVEAVGRFLGLADPPLIDMSKVEVKIQRDALSDEWRARFIAEAGTLAVFH